MSLQLIGLFFLLAGGLVKFAPEYVDKYGGKLIETMKDKMPQEISKHVEVILFLSMYYSLSITRVYFI